ncbi:MAG: HNH endonuclease [Deltaproteobacteria bacterium]
MYAENCVYTIVHSDNIKKLLQTTQQGTFRENKNWSRAKKMFDLAKSANQDFIILFAPAEDIWLLHSWAIITDIKISEDKKHTDYSFTNLKAFNNDIDKTELKLQRSDKNMDQNFIRPYALCKTPHEIIREEETKTIDSAKNAFLLVWNSRKELLQGDDFTELKGWRWSCGVTKAIKTGDRIFFAKVGEEPRGIVGSGYATTSVYSAAKWDDDNKIGNCIRFDFDVLLNPFENKILEISELKKGNLASQSWTPQSACSIKADILDELETVWSNFVNAQKKVVQESLSEEEKSNEYIEGGSNDVLVTKYERNKQARNECILHHGYSCTVCSINFEEKYGEIGKNFIHVHHLTPIALHASEHAIDPIKDLVPVCPNCHAIIHRQDPPYTIQNVKEMIETS